MNTQKQMDAITRLIERALAEAAALGRSRKARRTAKPIYGEPEGSRPGTRPTVAEPDDLVSPADFPQATPITSPPINVGPVPPGSASVGNSRPARARPPVGRVSDDEKHQRYLVEATVLTLARSINRPLVDLRAWLWDAAQVEWNSGLHVEFNDALRAAARKVRGDVAEGTR